MANDFYNNSNGRNAASWQITLFGSVFLLVIGGIAIAVINNNGDKTSRVEPPAKEQVSPQPLLPGIDDIVERVENSVARIEFKRGGGTGFLIRPNIVVTNEHVIRRNFVELMELTFPSAPEAERGPHKAKLLYIAPDWDIAFLEVQTSLPPLPMASDHQFRRGQEILVIGNPGGLQNAVNVGVLSSQEEYQGNMYYQLGISINPGNSGGPVINRQGEVIGLATLKSTKMEGIAFCIPSHHVLESLAEMEKQTEQEKENSMHRAIVVFRMLTELQELCQEVMEETFLVGRAALAKGLSPAEGLKARSEDFTKLRFLVKLVKGDMDEKIWKQIQQDTNLSEELRRKLTDFFALCVESESYADNPKGISLTSYEKKLEEFRGRGIRLKTELRMELGIPHFDSDDED
jgi:S1-C subfamily serine protease